MPVPPECLPTEGYLAPRLTYGQENGLACDAFHLAAGLLELTAALGKQVWIQSHGERLYLNPSFCLVGRTACGKSQTLRMSRRILRRLQKVHVLSGSYSTEGLEKILTGLGEPEGETPEAAGGAPTGPGGPDRLLIPLPWQEEPEKAKRLARAHQGAALLTFDELARLLESGAKHYNVDLPTTVGSLLDSGATVDRILVKGRWRAEDLCVSAFALTQPVYFFERLRPTDLLRGPVTRFCLVMDEGRRPRYGYQRGAQETTLNLLAKELHAHSETEGELDCTGIREATTTFERRLYEELSPALSEEEAALLDARLPLRALQLAALYHLAEKQDPTIHPKDYARSTRLLLYLREQTLALMRRHYAPTYQLRRWKQILNLVPAGRGLDERDLMRSTGITREELGPLLRSMEEAQTIFRTGKGVPGSPRQVWRPKPLPLASPTGDPGAPGTDATTVGEGGTRQTPPEGHSPPDGTGA